MSVFRNKSILFRRSKGPRQLPTIFSFSLVGVVLLSMVVAIALVLWREVVRFEHKSSNEQGVLLLASYPRYLSTDDQGGIVITAVNTGQYPMTSTVVSFVPQNCEHLDMGIDGTSLIRFGELVPGERKTRLIKFQVNHINSQTQKLQVDLKLSARISSSVTNILTTTLPIEPVINSLILPIDTSKLVLSQRFTIPNLFVFIATFVVVIELVMEIIKKFPENRRQESNGKLPPS